MIYSIQKKLKCLEQKFNQTWIIDILFYLQVILVFIKAFKNFKKKFYLWLANTLPKSYESDKLRAKFIAKTGVKIGEEVRICQSIEITFIENTENIIIGKKSFINSGVCFACASSDVEIAVGNYVMIGPQCRLETTNHSVTLLEDNKRGKFRESIVIEDQVWLAADVTVLPGVRIGKGSVVAAGAVVTKDVPPYSLVGGVPARMIRSIEKQNIECSSSIV